MSREIKFRAWAYNHANEKYTMSQVANESARYIIDNETFNDRIIMQFTGLKDKNGVDIYEGDIVKSAYGANKDKVVFNNGSFCCFGEPMGFQEEDHVIIESRVYMWAIVIGNIYQNPELLP